jgi:gas vesicle protein
MTHQEDNHSLSSFFTGFLIGGTAGAVISLMLAPQSGKETRDQIEQKGIEILNSAAESADKVVEQVRETGKQVSTDVRRKAGDLTRRGQEMIDEKLEQVSELLTGDNRGL